MCRSYECANMQICRCADAMHIRLLHFFGHLHICISAHLHIRICTSIKKALSLETRRLLNIFQIRLLTFTSVDRILNVIVMYDYFFE